VLFLSQCLSSTGFVAAFTVNALVAVELTGRPAAAGVPGATYVAGQAGGALLWGYVMERLGRRRGIVAGQVFGVLGALLAGTGVLGRSFAWVLVGLFLVGMARAAVDLGRFAAAEIHRAEERGRAISRVVLGSTAGAIVGPLVVAPMAKLPWGPGNLGLAGSYLAGAAVLALAAIIVHLRLRPDPRDLARELAATSTDAPAAAIPPLRTIVSRPRVVVAIVSMACCQVAMMIPMSITSVHMKNHAHTLGAISVVISGHTLGMYAFSLFTGKLVDWKGRAPVIVAGAVIMVLACAWGAFSTGLWPLVGALFALGLGWNLAYVAASALLSDQLAPAERSRTQGFGDLVINASSGVAQIASGVVCAKAGYPVVCAIAAAAALVPVAMLFVARQRMRSATF
jgi:MFS family permease